MPRTESWLSAIGVVAILIVAIYVLGAALTTPRAASTQAGSDAWTRSIAWTTCVHWRDEMTTRQRDDMARAYLPVLRRGVDSTADDGAPVAVVFSAAISRRCQEPDVLAYPAYSIIEAAGMAFMETEAFQP